MRKISLAIIFLASFCLFFSCSSQEENLDNIKKVNVNLNVKELTYLEAKNKALEAVGLLNYNPLVLNASYSESGYDFVFYPIELGKIFAVNVKRYTSQTSARTFRDIAKYSYLDIDTDYLLADLALNMAINDAEITLPNGYEYRVWMEQFDGNPVYYATFADEVYEYKYIINAYLSEASLMSKDKVNKKNRKLENSTANNG